MKIEQAKSDQYPAIQKLLKICDLPSADIGQPNQVFYVHGQNNNILGVCGIELYDGQALLRSLAVHPDKRGTGLGSKLLEYTIQKAEQQYGVELFYLLTTTAAAYFKKKGWKELLRESAPAAIKASQEFSSICPESAVCLTFQAAGSKAELARDYFHQGFNCSQSVLTAFSNDYGIQPETALRIATGFGGGICSKGEICGAVTGAYMALGLKYGRVSAEDTAARDLTYKKMREFDAAFIAEHGSLVCKKLLDGDLNNSDEREALVKAGKFEKSCTVFVQTATHLANNLLNKA